MNPFNSPEQYKTSTDEDTNESPDAGREATTGEDLKDFFEKRRSVWETFAQRGDFRVEVDESLDTFAFSHKDNTVRLPTKFLEGVEISDSEKKFAVSHELAHLVQLFQDPDAYTESFDIAEKKAEEQDNPKLKKLYHSFFNKMLDIHDNSIVKRRNRTFQEGQSEGDTPRQLYKEKLFAETDLRGGSLADQFGSYLLRKAMIPDEEVQVDEPVRKVLDEPIELYGKEYESFEAYALAELSDSTSDIRHIMNVIKADLLPIFDDLVEQDIEEGNPLDPDKSRGGESGEGESEKSTEGGEDDEQEAEEGGQEGEDEDEDGESEAGDGSSQGGDEENEEGGSQEWDIDDGLPEETIKDIAEEIKKSQQKGKSIEEAQREWARGAGFSEQETNTMLEIADTTEEVSEKLRNVWQNFIQKSFEIERKKQARFKSGSTIDTGRLAAEMPKILGGQPTDARIFSRYTAEQKETVYKPKRITLDLVVDLSGSMHSSGGEKMRSTQEAVYSLLESLVSFYRKERHNFPSDKEFPISIDYRALGFGDDVVELTDRTEREQESRKKDITQKDLKEEIWRAVLRMEENELGGTQDAPALRMIADDIDENVEKDLENEEEIKVVLEITDGETSTAGETESLVTQLNEKANVYCRGIQIPGSYVASEGEAEAGESEGQGGPRIPKVKEPSGTFEEVWGDEWGKKLEDISALKETVQAVLYDALEDKVS